MKILFLVGLSWLTLLTISQFLQQQLAFTTCFLSSIPTSEYHLATIDRSDTTWNVSKDIRLDVVCYNLSESDECIRILYIYNEQQLIFKDCTRNSTYFGPDFQFEDFNFDGISDLTIRSFESFRGINELRKLYVYSKTNKNVYLVKNSEEYPNLATTPNRQFIRSWIVTGINSTVFLHLQGDSLVSDVWVDLYPDSVIVTNSKNQEKKFPNRFGDFYFFEQYDPLR